MRYPDKVKAVFKDSYKRSLIEQNNWEEFYKIIPVRIIGEVSEFLLSIGINPLLYMEYVPNGFLMRSNIKSIEIPDHIYSIGRNAFYGCTNLKKITFGKKLKSIGEDAFKGCDNLDDITYKGSRIEWRNIALWFGNPAIQYAYNIKFIN